MSRGLSPLARGNHWRDHTHGVNLGPIPARAGEPASAVPRTSTTRAYPRSRGGTMVLLFQKIDKRGLSPLARGNLHVIRQHRHAPGPIPARAGEPRAVSITSYRSRAYPRSRGGTHPAGRLQHLEWGLSPLARGNRLAVGHASIPVGPIPARAGEPHQAPGRCWSGGAYPRSRGGTTALLDFGDGVEGLSPLARGNRWCKRSTCPPWGPIPARAGEPSDQAQIKQLRRAYPRSRGGTSHI